MKISIPCRTNLNEKMLSETFEITPNINEAEFIISQSSIYLDQDLSRTIYVAVEPPLAEHRLMCYSKFDQFHTVITHNPDLNKKNQFPFTDSDEPQYYPVEPITSKGRELDFVTRKDTTIKNRGIFYAGVVGNYEHVPNSFGGINLTIIRRLLGDAFEKNPNSKIIGIGRNGQTAKVNDWRLDKHQQIKDSNCDFVLALENTMFPNYLYEKIWDGFVTDKVTLYLGDPNVEKHIPLNCFVDLRPFFNKESGEIDIKGIQNLINEMTQKEYDQILKNARDFREMAKGRHQELKDKLTKKIIKIIKNE